MRFALEKIRSLDGLKTQKDVDDQDTKLNFGENLSSSLCNLFFKKSHYHLTKIDFNRIYQKEPY